jgi:hypothetical protein
MLSNSHTWRPDRPHQPAVRHNASERIRPRFGQPIRKDRLEQQDPEGPQPVGQTRRARHAQRRTRT